MITFRISAKLAKTIHEYELPSFSEHDGSPYLEWYGTSFTIKRIPYIIICNMQTLMSVLVSAQGITDLKCLYETFLKHLGEVLSDLDCSLIFRRIIVPNAVDNRVTEANEIPVVSVTNQIIEKLKQKNRTVEMSAREMSIWINRNQWKQLGGRTPLDVFVNSPGLGFIVESVRERDGEAVKKKALRKSGQKSSGNLSVSWKFTRYFRAGVYSWNRSSLASKRIAEAVREIKDVAKKNPEAAAFGITIFIEKCWASLVNIDSSSGQIGIAVSKALAELAVLFGTAPLDDQQKNNLLERIWESCQNEDYGYYDEIGEYWPQMCGSDVLVNKWADEFLPIVKMVMKDTNSGTFFKGTAPCLACLIAAKRYDEVFQLFDTKRNMIFHYYKYKLHALAGQGKIDDAINELESYALNSYQTGGISHFGEKILLEAGMQNEAYRRFGIMANRKMTGLATFNAIRKKYPQIETLQILNDLLDSEPQNKGKYFASARKAGFEDLAVDIAENNPVDPKTLTTACTEELTREPRRALHYGLLALSNYSAGFGYDVLSTDITKAYTAANEAAVNASMENEFKEQVMELIINDKSQGKFFSKALGIKNF